MAGLHVICGFGDQYRPFVGRARAKISFGGSARQAAQHSESRNSSSYMGIWTENNTQNIHTVADLDPGTVTFAIALQSSRPDAAEVF